MNINEINDAFDREYEKYKNSPEYKEGFIKLKMPKYYIAKHSDEELQAAVLAERIKCSEDYLADCVAAVEAARLEEREACAKVCESEGARIDASWESCATAIRARGEK